MGTSRQKLDEYLDKGKKPSLAYITLMEAPSYMGKLEESPAMYQSVAMFPRVVIGQYRGVVIVLDVRAI